MCKELTCACPASNDPRWDCVVLNESGLDRHFPQKEGVGWARLAFTLDNAALYRIPALLISNPADAERVFVNGFPLGGEGDIAPRYETVPGPSRVIEVPPGVLRNGQNELTMKVLFAAKNEDLFDGPFLLGNHNRILLAAERMQLPVIGLEAAFLTLFGVIVACYSVLIMKSGYRTDYVLFATFTTNYAAIFFLGSRTFHLLGFGGHFLDYLQSILSLLNTFLMLSLVTSVTGSAYGTVYFLLAASTLGFLVLYAILSPIRSLVALAAARNIHFALIGAYYVLMAARSLLRRRKDSVPVFAGVLVYVAGSRSEEFWGLNLRDYSMGIFTLCMLYTLLSRHARMQSRVMTLTSRLLDAHEEERRRIARDIHDSVGQSLLALKLRLQMLSAKGDKPEPERPSPETLDTLVEETSGIIDEVRRVSLDLRPSFIESMSLMKAVSWYAGIFMERNVIDVHVHGGKEELPDPTPRTKDHLYRVLQEILSNAVKHAHANRIDISLYRDGGTLVLKVSDNGVGFVDPGNKGIGMATMQERAELLGGSCSFDSLPGTGTTVTLEVPLP